MHVPGVIFVDTGPFLGRYHARDQHHEASCAGFRDLEARRARLVTSSYVLDELFTLLGRRAGYAFAAERARAIYDSRALRVLRPEERDEREAVALFVKLADQRVSFTDCVSIALMRRHHLERAFTFDRHFAAAGLVPWSGSEATWIQEPETAYDPDRG